MWALCYHGPTDVRVVDRPAPEIIDERDAVVRVTLAAIGGHDLDAFRGDIPGLEEGRVLGREFVGVVEEVGDAVFQVREGDRVLLPAAISCGECSLCRREAYAHCLRSNPTGRGGASFGSSFAEGGFDGGQAEEVRVPFVDATACVVPAVLSDEQALLCGDALAAGYQAARAAGIKGRDRVAVWGCGAVGLFAQMSARLLGGERVFAVDKVAERIELAARLGADVIDCSDERGDEGVFARTEGRGADACFEAVGAQKAAWRRRRDPSDERESAFAETVEEAVRSCAPTGAVMVLGSFPDARTALSVGPALARGVRLGGGPVSARALMPELFHLVSRGRIDPTVVITHRGSLAEAPKFYGLFDRREDGCIKVLLRP